MSFTCTTAGKLEKLPLVLKSKPTDVEVCNMVNKMAQACGLSLAVQYEKHKMSTDFRYLVHARSLWWLSFWLYCFNFRFCSRREVELCRLNTPVLRHFMPTVYHTLMDERQVRQYSSAIMCKF